MQKTRLVSIDGKLEKSPHMFTLHFLLSSKCTAMQSNASSLPIMLSLSCYAAASKRNA